MLITVFSVLPKDNGNYLYLGSVSPIEERAYSFMPMASAYDLNTSYHIYYYHCIYFPETLDTSVNGCYSPLYLGGGGERNEKTGWE